MLNRGQAELNGSSSADPLCPWDPDAARLLKVVDSENLEALETLIASGVHVNGHGGTFHETALHRAAMILWAEGVKFLISMGASVYAKNQFGQTPLHYAAASKSTACIKLLLDNGKPGIKPGVLDHKDTRGHTPLHDAAATGCVNAVSALIKAGADVKAQDNTGETPLHKAAKKKNVPSMVALLNAGAELACKDKHGESVLTYTLLQLPGTMDEVFDSCIVINSSKLNNKNLKASMEFRPLTGSDLDNQVQNLQTFVDMSHAKLLSHPLLETFLFLKWMKVRKLFLIEVIFYLLYAMLTTVLTFNKFVWTTSNTTVEALVEEKGEAWKEWAEDHVFEHTSINPLNGQLNHALKGIVVFQTVLILLQQLLSMMQNKLAWLRSISGVLHVIIALLVLLVVPSTIPQEWQHHMATWLLLLMWTECMLLIGRFPNCGIYVVMFQRVATVFLKIFAIYFCLLLAFSSAFYITLNFAKAHGEPGETTVFTNPLLTFVKTLTMMIGELDFGDEFVNGLSHLVFTGHTIFLFFVILVSIILSNLLVALAVNDVQGLRNSAHLERLIKQTELVFQMERNCATAAYLAYYVNIPKLNDLLMKAAQLCKHKCQENRVFLFPNDPKKANQLFVTKHKKCEEYTLPSHILTNVMECLRTREMEVCNTKSSMKSRRGSRKRRGDYHQNNNEEVKVNIKDLEADMTDIVNEKMEDIAESYLSLNKKMVSLEEKLEKALTLLSANSQQMLSTNNQQMQSANSQQIHSSNSQQMLSANSQQSLLTNSQQILSSNSQQMLSANSQQMQSANSQQMPLANNQQILPINSQQMLSASNLQMLSPSSQQIPPLNNQQTSTAASTSTASEIYDT